MSATTAFFVLMLVGVLVVGAITLFALYAKGNVRASGRIGNGSFDIETTEKLK